MATRSEIHDILEDVALVMKSRQAESGWWIAYCEEVPEARTQGATKEEVRENLLDAVVMILEDFTLEELHEFRRTVGSEQSELIFI